MKVFTPFQSVNCLSTTITRKLIAIALFYYNACHFNGLMWWIMVEKIVKKMLTQTLKWPTLLCCYIISRCRFAEVLVSIHFVFLGVLWLSRDPRFIPGWASFYGAKSRWVDERPYDCMKTVLMVIYTLYVSQQLIRRDEDLL